MIRYKGKKKIGNQGAQGRRQNGAQETLGGILTFLCRTSQPPAYAREAETRGLGPFCFAGPADCNRNSDDEAAGIYGVGATGYQISARC